MKTLLKILCVLVCIGMLTNCNKDESFIEQEEIGLKAGIAGPVFVTVPFEADFMGTYMEGSGPCPECGPWDPANGDFWGIIYNEGGGTATHLGKFQHYFEFCCDFLNGYYPGDHMVAYFVAANGDSLFVYCSGQVIDGRLDHHPEDVNSYFMDPFVILGGTGKFKGASGSGYTDDYNRDALPDNSFHHWSGTITLKKGNR